MAVVDRRLCQLDELLVERLVETVILADALDQGLAVRVLGDREDRADVESRCLPVVNGSTGVEEFDMTDHLGHRPEPELGHELADLLGDELEERLDELGLAAEAGAQLGVLRGDPDRAGVQMTDPHHDAARHDERRRGEPVLLGAEQRRDDRRRVRSSSGRRSARRSGRAAR